MNNNWSKIDECCSNCGTTRRPHKARGLCVKCYVINRRIEIVSNWDLSTPKSLKGYPKERSYREKEKFIKIKKGFLSQLKERLKQIASQEMSLKRQATGHDLENKMRNIANLCGVDGYVLFDHSADEFNRWLDDDQKNFLFKKLHIITENVRWTGIDWWKIWEQK